MTKTWTKIEIAQIVAKKTNIKPLAAKEIISAIFTVLREAMEKANPEGRIEIRNFGVFEVKSTKAKPKARNPKTNEVVYVPPRRKTHYIPGKLLKEELRNIRKTMKALIALKIEHQRAM